MAAGKRGAVAAASPPAARGGKKAKTAPKPPPTPFEEACEAIFGLLDDHEDMNPASRTMLREAGPMALRVQSEDRHRFQHALIASVSEALDAVKAQRQKHVQSLEAECAEGKASKEQAGEELKAATEARATLMTERDAAKAAMDASESGVLAAAEALEAEKKTLESLQEENQKECARKAQMETLITEVFAQLKAGTIAGQQWRARNKMIDDVVAKLSELDVEESIRLALPVAFKTKVQERGAFAQKAVDFADEALKQALSTLEASLKSHENNVSQQEGNIKVKDEGLAAARAVREKGEAEYIAAENKLLTGDELATQRAESLAAREASCEALVSSLDGVRVKLEQAGKVLERFQALVANGEAGAAPSPAEAQEPTTAAAVDGDAGAADAADDAATSAPTVAVSE